MWPAASPDFCQQGERARGDYKSRRAVLLHDVGSHTLEPAASRGPSLCVKDEGGCNLLNFMPISSSPWGSWKMANAITGLRKV